MTYEELMQFINGAQTMPWTQQDYNAGAFNPNSMSGQWTGTADPIWSGMPGSEAFYQEGLGYDSAPSMDRDALFKYLNDNGMSWQVAQKGNETANYVVGPDGKPMADTANFTRAEDERFKLAMLAAMGVTGANVLGAGFGVNGAAEAAGGGAGGGSGGLQGWDAAMADSAASGSITPEWMGAAETAGGGAIKTLPGSLPAGPGQVASIATGMNPAMSIPALDTLAKVGGAAGGLLGGAGDLLKVALPIAGAIGGSQESEGETITRESKMDPRMDKYVYDSYMPALQAQYEKGKKPNANQQRGWDMQLGLLTDPARMKQMQDMQAAALGRYNAPVAGNPFANGTAALYQSRRGLLGGG